jgi:hypothetical protein
MPEKPGDGRLPEPGQQRVSPADSSQISDFSVDEGVSRT